VHVNAGQSFSMNAAAASAREPASATAETVDSATDLEAVTAICRWTSKRISAVEGSHFVLARYSQKSSTASQEDDATGSRVLCNQLCLVGQIRRDDTVCLSHTVSFVVSHD